MPDDYYVSQYSGEEIDALLGGAGEGAVRYDAAQSLTDAQKTQARANINAAPGNFGFGALPPVISDPDSLIGTVDGIYNFYNLDNPIKGEASGILVHYQGNFLSVSSSCRQIFYPGGKWAYHLERAYSGTWTEWEWVNPPVAQLGAEYRTTERYLGKPVYVKLVNFGELPNATTKSVSHRASNVDVCIRATGAITSGDKRSIPFADSNGRVDIFGDDTYVTIKTDYNFSSTAAYVTIWYTKTTD